MPKNQEDKRKKGTDKAKDTYKKYGKYTNKNMRIKETQKKAPINNNLK